MTATDVQVRIMMREREKGRTQEQAAASANLRSRKTAAKYERLGQLPSVLKQPRTYRTRADPFAEDWPVVEEMLATAPELEAKTLFEWLCGQYPGKYQEGQLRTFQRRVSRWRALHGQQVAVLEQVHHPGEVLQTDGVWLTELGVTIQGEPFKHLVNQRRPKKGQGAFADQFSNTDQRSALSFLLGLQAVLRSLFGQLGLANPRVFAVDSSL